MTLPFPYPLARFRVWLLLVLAAFLMASPARAEIPQRQWLVAETQAFRLHSDGPQFELQRWAKKIAWFDMVLRAELGGEAREDGPPLDIFLLADPQAVSDIVGQQYLAGVYVQSSEGPFLVANRRPAYERTRLSGQASLFHEYAHHYMYRHRAAAYPAWYREGFAEYVSTVAFDIDGRWTFGEPAGYRLKQLAKDRVSARTLLLEDVDALRDKDRPAYYAWAWLLTHMLKSTAEGQARLDRYLAAFASGADREAAAAHLGGIDAVQRALDAYAEASLRYRRSSASLPDLPTAQARALSPLESRLVDLGLARRLGHRREEALGELRALALNNPKSAPILAELARAEYAVARARGAASLAAPKAALSRLLAVDPQHPDGNLLAVQIALREHETRTASGPTDWDALRERLAIVLAADPDNPAALTELFHTYLSARTRPTPRAFVAIERAFAMQPESTRIRVVSSYALALRGKFAEARARAGVLSSDPHHFGAGRKALATLARMERSREAAPVEPD